MLAIATRLVSQEAAMWDRVEQAVDDLRPLIRSVGVDAEVVDVIDRIVTLQLKRTDEDSNPDLTRLRSFLAQELQSEVTDIREVKFEGALAPVEVASSLVFDVDEPTEADETAVLTFDRPMAPPATTVYDNLEVAADRPEILAILRVPGVVSVVGRGERLIVARSGDAEWSGLLSAIDAAVRQARAGEPGGIHARVQEILERDVNPSLAAHGGYIELLEVKDADLYIHMGGGCQGCAQSQATLRQGVESQLRAAVPEIGTIFDTTDHAAGTNPYYRG